MTCAVRALCPSLVCPGRPTSALSLPSKSWCADAVAQEERLAGVTVTWFSVTASQRQSTESWPGTITIAVTDSQGQASIGQVRGRGRRRLVTGPHAEVRLLN
jgi:hypothetical protein